MGGVCTGHTGTLVHYEQTVREQPCPGGLHVPPTERRRPRASGHQRPALIRPPPPVQRFQKRPRVLRTRVKLYEVNETAAAFGPTCKKVAPLPRGDCWPRVTYTSC
jgi:hypothetical protein